MICKRQATLLMLLLSGVFSVGLSMRLPRSILPENYRIKLIALLDEDNPRLVGTLRLDFVATQDTDRIVMHAVDLQLVEQSVSVTTLSRGDPRKLSVAELLLIAEGDGSTPPPPPVTSVGVDYDVDAELVTIRLSSMLLESRRYQLSFNYRGQMSDTLRGLYRSSYVDRISGKKRWLASTQFEPVAARLMFPCLDEPDMKASFEMIVGRSGNLTSLSNMPLIRTEPMRNKEGWFWDHYEKSVPMSTYLVALVISDFDFRQGESAQRQVEVDNTTSVAMSTSMRVWAQPDLLEQAEGAARIAPPMLEFLERYFQVPFPLPKMDFVALPDFASKAMENWGLITFRESVLLVDPSEASVFDELTMKRVVAHELAHQWFGNLVTMKWWNDLWLNEGFATYVARVVLDNVTPAYDYGTLQGLDYLNVMESDSLESSHPISVEVHHPNQINELFDLISYVKGSAIIRMMNHFLGEPTFRQALSNYLTENEYANAGQDDLWRSMTKQARTDGVLPTDIDVKTIMDTWTLQMGFPMITVTRNYETGLLHFQQERFVRSTGSFVAKNLVERTDVEANNLEEEEPKYRWWVPISLTDAVEGNFDDNNTQPRVWLSPERADATLATAFDADAWVVANIQSTGFFRVNYDERNWQLLAAQLRRDHEVIHVLNRAQLISDAFALATVNVLPYTTAFNLIQYLDNEDHHVPWTSALKSLSSLGLHLQQTAHYGRYQAFKSSLVHPAYIRIGSEFREDDQPMMKMARVALTAQACATGFKPCIRRAQQLYEDWMNSADPLSFNEILPDQYHTIYCTAIKYGSSSEWNFAYQMSFNVTSSQHRDRLLEALGCSREPWLLVRYLSLALDVDSGIRRQDGPLVVGAVAKNPIARSIVFAFLRHRFDELVHHFTIRQVMKMLTAATRWYNTVEEMKQVEEFLSNKADSMKTMRSSANKILTTIAANIEWVNQHAVPLIDWFQSNGF